MLEIEEDTQYGPIGEAIANVVEVGDNIVVPCVSQPQPWAHDQGKGLQRCEPKVNPRITFHVPESAKECEGMNPHTLK